MLVTVEAGAGVWWNYKFIKTAEPPPPSPFMGTWVMAPERLVLWASGPLSSMSLGGMVTMGSLRRERVTTMMSTSSIRMVVSEWRRQQVTQGETWVEGWQGASEADACAAPVAPHDGSIAATWSHDQSAGTLTITGQGILLWVLM